MNEDKNWMIGASILIFGSIVFLLVYLQNKVNNSNAKAEDEKTKREALEIETRRIREENANMSSDIEQLERNFRKLGAERAELQRKLKNS